jgi:hypothetical protein
MEAIVLKLSREQILQGLRDIDEEARRRGVLIDLAVYGGAAMALAFDLRQATKDVDAVVRGSPDLVREVVRRIALDRGWPEDWLNDGVKGFLSSREQMAAFEEFSSDEPCGLRVYVPMPEYLFAMKCMAMRVASIEATADADDIIALARIIGLESVEEALDLVEGFYPKRLIPPKVRFGLEELMDRVMTDQDSVPAPDTPP